MARARRKHHPGPAPAAAVPVPEFDGLDVPPELADPGAAVWHDQRTYRAFMLGHRWRLPTAERAGAAPSSPANRRQAAAAGWARENGVVTTYGSPQNRPHPDWHQLRTWGLVI